LVAEFILSQILRSLCSLRMTEAKDSLRMTEAKDSLRMTEAKDSRFFAYAQNDRMVFRMTGGKKLRRTKGKGTG